MIIFSLFISDKTFRNIRIVKNLNIIFIIDILIFYLILRKYFYQLLEVRYFAINNIQRSKSYFYLEFLASCCWIISLSLNSLTNYWYLLENLAIVGIAGSAFICNLFLIGQDIFKTLKKIKRDKKIIDLDSFQFEQEEKKEVLGSGNIRIKYLWGYDDPASKGFEGRMFDYVEKHRDDIPGRYMAFMDSPDFIEPEKYFRA